MNTEENNFSKKSIKTGLLVLGFIIITVALAIFLTDFNYFFYSIWDADTLNWLSIKITVLPAIFASIFLYKYLQKDFRNNEDVKEPKKTAVGGFIFMLFFIGLLFIAIIRFTVMMVNVGFDNSTAFVPHATVIGAYEDSGKGAHQNITIKDNITGKENTLETTVDIFWKYKYYKTKNKIFEEPIHKGFLGIIYSK
ncbi:hypothetical protein EZJ43_07765 [Pedobacter changchengzhani]|uniref:Uncharacterized protein n=1 Tax=Pedobacter changchengzhani TaxID=2529274 RepID=A0A4R5MLP3_9SPHI|nr:hypothetical protein [Pedobacter changchengzhani]TDG36406.1 hypothetical protein EZJ43_07765 [Pedobacter changchengzhani]